MQILRTNPLKQQQKPIQRTKNKVKNNTCNSQNKQLAQKQTPQHQSQTYPHSSPFGALSSWNESLHFCEWSSVACGRRHQRVIELDQHSYKLVGGIPPSIGNLSFLSLLNLENSSLSSNIPGELGHLFRLQMLRLSNNSFSGEIPVNISSCRNLIALHLEGNNLTEYGVGSDVSTYGDVYNFGILLLEMFTEKRPTDDMFKYGLNLHNNDEMALPGRVSEVMEPILLREDVESSIHSSHRMNHIETGKTLECLISIIKIGVACSICEGA